jgi:predicted MFS family arabinose efflux permease
VYRLWRDLGYVAGGLLAGVLADLLGFRPAIGFVAALTALSGLAAWRCLPRSGPVMSARSDATGDRTPSRVTTRARAGRRDAETCERPE